MAAPSTIPSSTDVRPPRDRMVRAAAKLFRVHGVTATGLREIVEAADAPRGSLQHYFPGGKEQLITEALQPCRNCQYAGFIDHIRHIH